MPLISVGLCACSNVARGAPLHLSFIALHAFSGSARNTYSNRSLPTSMRAAAAIVPPPEWPSAYLTISVSPMPTRVISLHHLHSLEDANNDNA